MIINIELVQENASKTHPKSGHKHRVVLEIRAFLE